MPGSRLHQPVLQHISPRYAGSLAALAPVIYRWKRQGDLGAREIVKERLGLTVAPVIVAQQGKKLVLTEYALNSRLAPKGAAR